MSRVGPIVLLGLAACASSVPRTVPRVVDGKVEHGSFVSPYAYEWYIEGEILAAEGRHEEAALAFENATAAPSIDVFLMCRLAEEHEKSGATRRADRILALAKRYHPSSARVALTEGRIQESRQEHSDALSSFVRARRLAPTWDEPVIAMAEAFEAGGNPERSAAVLLAYLVNVPQERSGDAHRSLIELARRTGDVETLVRGLALDPGSTPETRARAAGRLALQIGRPALAARLLQDARRTRQNTSLWLRALIESGDRQEAADFLASPAADRIGDKEERAKWLLEIGAADEALDLLSNVKRSPQSEYSKGRALLADGRYVDAARILADIPFGAASFEAARLALADCSLSQQRRGAAAEAVSVVPHSSLAIRRKLAEIYLREGELRAGLRLFDPRRAEDRAALASLYERAGRFEEASAYYASVSAHSRGQPRLRARASAELLASRGLRRDAITVLEQWTATAPEDLYARVRLVELLEEDDQTEAAQKKGRRALALVDEPLLRAHLVALLTRTPPRTSSESILAE